MFLNKKKTNFTGSCLEMPKINSDHISYQQMKIQTQEREMRQGKHCKLKCHEKLLEVCFITKTLQIACCTVMFYR